MFSASHGVKSPASDNHTLRGSATRRRRPRFLLSSAIRGDCASRAGLRCRFLPAPVHSPTESDRPRPGREETAAVGGGLGTGRARRRRRLDPTRISCGTVFPVAMAPECYSHALSSENASWHCACTANARCRQFSNDSVWPGYADLVECGADGTPLSTRREMQAVCGTPAPRPRAIPHPAGRYRCPSTFLNLLYCCSTPTARRFRWSARRRTLRHYWSVGGRRRVRPGPAVLRVGSRSRYGSGSRGWPIGRERRRR